MSLVAILTLAAAPMPDGAALDAAIARRDAALFYAAFEGCDADALSGYIADDFRMVHDLAGLAVPDKAAMIEGTRERCAARLPGGAQEGYANRRLFVPGSRRVQRLGDWGALEEGHHTFHERRADGTWELTGGARYIHVWQWTGEEFVLSESISVDHGAAAPYPPAAD
ncbi:DUF4440 domain-containing protein [Sphingomicrobium clamense]|uniref:Nuclear transport factor 2 family protein n=1 Tax=Sphingomicrobium clamense TaxID=2851013 RepID=A0ABS6V3W4_9SPHN|nr:DUF4440 domain-containing protein [Sphingomicrobium sp. B8]MBW0144229.1 nuclear transport factor 2 family protein [Sphingomicrobium sp. B8]